MAITRNRYYDRILIAAFIALITFVAYFPVLKARFINYDDPGYVTKNVHVQSGLSIETINWAFTSTDEANWHPITWISHALDWSLFGADARYHHAVSLLLHIVSACLLFFLMERLTHKLWASTFVATMFAVHPMHVESVAWIAERKDVLSGLFWMLTIFAYLRYRESPSFSLKLSIIIFYILGLLSKPMIITLPFVLVLLDYWPLKIYQFPVVTEVGYKKLLVSIKEKIPLFILSLLSSLITFFVQQKGGATKAAQIGFTDRIFNAIVSYAVYIRKTIFPDDLSVFYPHQHDNIPLWETFLAFFIITAISVTVWKQRAKYPFMIVGWLWFIGTLVPVIGIVQVGLQSMADRYMYIPMIGISLMIAWGTPEIFTRIKMNTNIIKVLYVVIVLLMMYGTYTQAAYWHDSLKLFSHSVEVTSNNYIAENNYGAALADSGNHTDAINHLRKCLLIKPDYLEGHHNIARSFVAIGNYHEAIEHYRWMLNHGNNDPNLYKLIGRLLTLEGKLDDAISSYTKALQIDKNDFETRCIIAELYAEQSKFTEATTQCEIVLNVDPKNSKAHDILGIIAAKQELFTLALTEFDYSIEYDSNNADAYNDKGMVLDKLGQKDKARENFSRAVLLDPQNSKAQLNLGISLAQIGKYNEAESHWLNVIKLEMNNLEAHLNLAMLYSMNGKSVQAIQQFDAALRINPDDPQTHFLYGNFLYKYGKISEAESQYSEAIRIAPSFQQARSALNQIQNQKIR